MIPTFRIFKKEKKMKCENYTFSALYYDLKSFTLDDLFCRNTDLYVPL